MTALFPAALFGVFLVLLVMPFVPAVLELKFPRDRGPLFVKESCSGRPRYFARSFRRLLRTAMGGAFPSPGMKEAFLSKRETVEAAASKDLSGGQAVNHILYVTGDIRTGKGARLEKEVCATGSAFIGEQNVLRAIAADGDLFISRLTRVARWADSEAGMYASEGCDLGARAGCGGTLILAGNCVFKRLFGNPVIVCRTRREDQDKNADGRRAQCKGKDKIKKRLVIPPAARTENIFAGKDLLVRKGGVVSGGIKAYGDVTLEDGVTVLEDLFAEGDVDIGEGSAVLGNVFSQGFVRLQRRARVGQAGGVRSVIGKRGVVLEQDVAIYGYVMTEGKGMVK